MKDLSTLLQADLSGLEWDAWCDKLNDLAGDDGYCEPLGPDHAAVLIEKKPTLLVTFETRPGIAAGEQMGQSMAWPLTEALGWSHMALMARHESWFRDPHVYAFFDRLIDDGFFEEFDEVIFYGAGSCGYAACAFSVAAPGARVLALQPQATLDPRRTGWDKRFSHARRLDFNRRFGYAPDMLTAADHAWIMYDPDNTCDAMHASLLAGEHRSLVPARFLGDDLQNALLRMGVLFRMLAQISADKLTPTSLARLMRARREDGGYLTNLMLHLEREGQFARMKTMCEAVLLEREIRPIRRGLMRANRALEKGLEQG
ncbi:MAG: phosphoadenosine phosphosulfate reductase [Pseudomonadota bacterium]